ncbi:MAG: type II secretion system F family protein [Candidatus Saccharibacteria bacterium]|nr:type II secretion system F family protein [Candidatus Saccharibacteria bacterium]
MLTFKYTARDSSTGKKIKADVQAESEQSAARLIREQGLSPLDIEVQDTKEGRFKFGNRIKTKDKILFSRQLSTLINAGLPLVQSLRNVSSQMTSKPFKIVINQVITDVEAGTSFSQALAKHPKVFNQVFVSLIAAGETSGTLDESLQRLADQQEKDAEILSKVRGAMVYPIIVLLVMGAVVGFMLIKVLPQVEALYEGLPGGNLPLVTRILLAVSNFLVNYWWAFLILLALFGFFGFKWLRTIAGRRVADKAKMRLWPIGPLFMKLYMARFARTGTTLVASGVPLIQMLEIVANAINNVHIEDSMHRAINKVRGGKALSDSLKGDNNFLELVPNMLRIGEQSGSLEQMMEKTASYYEKEVDQQIKTISTIIEPVLMVVLGIFAFIIVAAILLPVYGLAGQSFI